MKQYKTFCVSFAALMVVAAMCPSQAFAGRGGSYSCKGDKGLDVAMEFAIRIDSAARVHLSAYGGSDKSGKVTPALSGAWRVKNAAGVQIDYFSKGSVLSESPYMLREVNLEGLVPGAAYDITLTSQDLCANKKTVQHSVTMPTTSSESTAPEVSTPGLVSIGGFGFSTRVLRFSAADDSGIRQIQIRINGTLVNEFNYSDGVSVRWWCDDFPDDNIESTLEGPDFYVSYATSYRGTSAWVEIVAVDIYGAQTMSGAQLLL